MQEGDQCSIEALLSPRNSLLIHRRFYSKTELPNEPDPNEVGLKHLTKQINGLKKKIKKYETEFEENFGYRPSHSDKMGNRDIKRLCWELSKLRREHKMLKEGIGSFFGKTGNRVIEGCNPTNNNNSQEKSRVSSMEEVVKEVERKLSEKRKKNDRSENMEELSYEQLMDEKTAVQKGLLHIENLFGRPVSKEDRAVVRSLYDKYRTMKRLLIRVGAVSRNIDIVMFHFFQFPSIESYFMMMNFFRVKIRTVCQNLRQYWNTKRWTLRPRPCPEVTMKRKDEPANQTCLTEEFWIVSIPWISCQLIAIVNTAVVKGVVALWKYCTPCHSQCHSNNYNFTIVFFLTIKFFVKSGLIVN